MNSRKYHVRTHKGLIFPLLGQDWLKANKSWQHSIAWKSASYLDGGHSWWLLQNKTQDPLVLMRYPLTTASTRHNETLQSMNIQEFWLSQCMQSAEHHMGNSASLAAANKNGQLRRTHRSGFPLQLCTSSGNHCPVIPLVSVWRKGFCGEFQEKWGL